MHRVLVTDAEQRSSLAVVRSLGQAGYSVEVSSVHPRPLAGGSRFVQATHPVPDPLLDPEGWLAELGAIVRRREIDILVPMTDVAAALGLSLRNDHPGLLTPFPPNDVWSEVADKKRLMEAAAEVGVPVPRQIVIDAPDADLGPVHAWAGDMEYPVVLKPHRSAVVSGGVVQSFAVQMVADAGELERAVRASALGAFPLLVQERIEGPGLGAFFLSNDGEVVASFAHRRLREKPPTGGVSVHRESVPLRDDLRLHSEALLRRFRWSGVAMVEFKEDAATGTPYLMEINGRFWGSLQLAIDSGVDFPTLLLEQFLGTPSQAPSSYAIGVRSRWLWGDMDHLVWLLRARHGYRDANPELPGRLGALARFLVPWRPRQHLEVMRLSDLRPFLRESLQWIQDVLPGRAKP